jgi:glucose 1-dehydrogenase
VAKAWEQIDRIGNRAFFAPRVALVTGAGPIGLLAALLARQRGFETHVVDLVTEGPKPQLVAALGAAYHSEPVEDLDLRPDVVVECTGVGEVAVAGIRGAEQAGVIALTGLRDSDSRHPSNLDAINRELVLSNKVVFGTVNAARRHYEQGAQALCRADESWLDRLVSRREPLDGWAAGLTPEDDDIKVVVEMNPPGERP